MDAMKECVIPHCAVVLHIDDDSLRFTALGKQDAVDQKLEAFQCFVPSADQSIRFTGADLKDEVPLPFLLLDSHNETEMAKNSVEDLPWILVHCSFGKSWNKSAFAT